MCQIGHPKLLVSSFDYTLHVGSFHLIMYFTKFNAFLDAGLLNSHQSCLVERFLDASKPLFCTPPKLADPRCMQRSWVKYLGTHLTRRYLSKSLTFLCQISIQKKLNETSQFQEIQFSCSFLLIYLRCIFMHHIFSGLLHARLWHEQHRARGASLGSDVNLRQRRPTREWRGKCAHSFCKRWLFYEKRQKFAHSLFYKRGTLNLHPRSKAIASLRRNKRWGPFETKIEMEPPGWIYIIYVGWPLTLSSQS